MGGTAERRNLGLLIAAQVLGQTSSIALIAISSLVAFELADNKAAATLPIALGMISSAVLFTPASYFMQGHGRRAGFMLGAVAGVGSAFAAWLSIHWHNYALFLLANVLFGAYQSCTQFYRFAAAEACAPERRAQAISWVVAAGLLSAFTGPALARLGVDLRGFAAVFLVLIVLGVVAALVLAQLRLPAMAPLAPGGGRPLSVIIAQPAFLAAAAASTAGYAVMAATMSATPLAMQLCGFSVVSSSSVIQWHMLGMFAPSLFAGRLFSRFGLLPMMTTGIVLLGASIMVAVSGQQLWQFYIALTLLGMGWNLLYVGGSTLLAQAWQPGEQAKVQSSHDLFMFTVASIGTFMSGRVLDAAGWNSVNTFTLPLIVIAAVALLVYWRSRRHDATLAAT